jgi:pantoate--beta-alanine ligase
MQERSMIIVKKAADLKFILLEEREQNRKIGFVPTMGALHQGHLSLILASLAHSDFTVCSIFVNPTQFNNPEDFKFYPKTIEKDIEQLIAGGCQLLFFPAATEIYPPGYKAKHYELGSLEHLLEGHFRPGHFQGVCQVMDRLLEIIEPDHLYMGQKDFQQCMVIRKLLQLTHRSEKVHLQIHPTERESDGLAMSSRNLRLSAAQREAAPLLYAALSTIKQHIKEQPFDQLEEKAAAMLTSKGFQVDYIQIAETETLAKAKDHTKPLVALVAASIGNIRLIDNLLLN